jgi:hypothetical protein
VGRQQLWGFSGEQVRPQSEELFQENLLEQIMSLGWWPRNQRRKFWTPRGFVFFFSCCTHIHLSEDWRLFWKLFQFYFTIQASLLCWAGSHNTLWRRVCLHSWQSEALSLFQSAIMLRSCFNLPAIACRDNLQELSLIKPTIACSRNSVLRIPSARPSSLEQL